MDAWQPTSVDKHNVAAARVLWTFLDFWTEAQIFELQFSSRCSHRFVETLFCLKSLPLILNSRYSIKIKCFSRHLVRCCESANSYTDIISNLIFCAQLQQNIIISILLNEKKKCNVCDFIRSYILCKRNSYIWTTNTFRSSHQHQQNEFIMFTQLSMWHIFLWIQILFLDCVFRQAITLFAFDYSATKWYRSFMWYENMGE